MCRNRQKMTRVKTYDQGAEVNAYERFMVNISGHRFMLMFLDFLELFQNCKLFLITLDLRPRPLSRDFRTAILFRSRFFLYSLHSRS